MPEKEYRFVPQVSVAVATSDLNIRRDAPATSGTIAREVTPGTPLPYVGYVLNGEAVADISKWFLTPDGDFFWSGNVNAESPAPGALVNKRILRKPLDTLICTQRFGERPSFYANLGSPGGHNGMDFRTKQSDGNWHVPVYSVLKGVVSEVAENVWNGKFIRIDHPNGFQSVYLHLSEAAVDTGQEVTAGFKIAVSGNSGGASEAPHLHFGYRPTKFDKDNGTTGYVDPAPYFIDEIKYLT